jgi:hypothetical protein
MWIVLLNVFLQKESIMNKQNLHSWVTHIKPLAWLYKSMHVFSIRNQDKRTCNNEIGLLMFQLCGFWTNEDPTAYQLTSFALIGHSPKPNPDSATSSLEEHNYCWYPIAHSGVSLGHFENLLDVTVNPSYNLCSLSWNPIGYLVRRVNSIQFIGYGNIAP